MKLVIVESPTKSQTIGRYLGKDFKVLATQGHIRDLATSGRGGLGVDCENGFTPTYSISSNKYGIVNELRDAVKKSSEVYLATDPDREGEAIAWHLTQVLGLNPKTNPRLEFHEITRNSIEEAITNPRTLDMNLVASQETRRILDRIIGFKLSGLLQKKLHVRSAGRVQSAVLKLICDHEKDIANFVPEEYWTLEAELENNKKIVKAPVYQFNGKGVHLSNKESTMEILNNTPEYLTVSDIKKTTRKIESKPPFTTSTLQQEAFNRFKFSTKKTSSLAQKLYEGINVGGEHVGLITYIRTDSIRLSETFVNKAHAYINETFGEQYFQGPKAKTVTQFEQDAHEAIRPTSNHRTPESVRQYLSIDEYKLYSLIYNRALGSLMVARKDEVTTAIFTGNNVSYKADGFRIVFDGYEVIYKSGADEEKPHQLPKFEIGDSFHVEKLNYEQKFTEPPARYSEAKLVRLMEEKGIGRPSTYASTISTLLARNYVQSEKGILVPTESGILTSHVLEKYFLEIVDDKYTAIMEKSLDDVHDGTKSRTNTIQSFYDVFMDLYNKASVLIYKQESEKVGRLCPKCGSELIVKKSKFGDFVACSNFPACDYVEKQKRSETVFIGEKCPVCGGELVERADSKGRKFVGCSNYPKCHYIKGKSETPTFKEEDYIKPCPKCNGHLVVKSSKHGQFLGCTNFPKCHYIEKYKQKDKK